MRAAGMGRLMQAPKLESCSERRCTGGPGSGRRSQLVVVAALQPRRTTALGTGYALLALPASTLLLCERRRVERGRVPPVRSAQRKTALQPPAYRRAILYSRQIAAEHSGI